MRVRISARHHHQCRLWRIAIRISAGGFNNSASIRYDDNSRFGGKVTWHLAPAWLIAATGTRLKASFGTGFKAPSLQQLFGAFRRTIPT